MTYLDAGPDPEPPTDAPKWDEPWWRYRCTHQDGPRSDWEVLQEAEQVVIIHHEPRHLTHVMVSTRAGSVCKAVPCAQYEQLDEAGVMALVQQQMRNLRADLG